MNCPHLHLQFLDFMGHKIQCTDEDCKQVWSVEGLPGVIDISKQPPMISTVRSDPFSAPYMKKTVTSGKKPAKLPR